MLTEILNYFLTSPEMTATILLVAVLLSLEFARPLKKIPIFSQENKETIIWMVLNKILVTSFIGLMIVQVSDFISLQFVVINLENWHWSLQLALFFIINDIISYLGHRFLHQSDILWRFHKLHHSVTEITTWSAFRHHAFEELYYGVLVTVVASLMVMNPVVKLAVFILVSAACYFQHANLRLRLGRFISYVFITPHNHRWHHALNTHHSRGQNFGLFLTIWDRLGNTYYVPEHEPEKLGVEDYPRGILKRFFYPFIRSG